MRTPRGRGTERRARTVAIPAPILGWNARDSFEAMDARFAIRLTNWIPGLLGVRLRKGHQIYADGLDGPVETLMEYAPPNVAGREFYAAAGTGIYEATAAGGVGSPVVTGLTNARWQHTNFGTAAGSFMILVNGADAPRYYDGVAFANMSITGSGLTPSNLTHVANHKNRLWFCEKGTLNAWYLGTSAIAGTATKFPLSSLCRLGGELTAIGTWTRDGGNGSDDLWVAVTSEGEVLVYSGTDPANAATWSLVGVFRIAKPITRRCFIKAGADLGVLTTDGPLSLQNVLPASGAAQRRMSLTDNISEAFRRAYSIAPLSTLWSILEVPREGLVIMNIPDSSATNTTQFVMSSDTGGWADWVNINATSIGLFNDEIYFGKADGTIWKYGPAYQDGDQPITTWLQGAFTRIGGASNNRITMVRPIMQGPPGYIPAFSIRTDYDISPPNTTTTTATVGGTMWDEGDWDVGDWGAPSVTLNRWSSVSGIGTTVSVSFSIATDTEVLFQGVDLTYESAPLL